ncbi:hypothetical protein [Paenibacillus pectinilyticus]|uniref:hypothetical protein n=1 Tax=Paenibacillus pectinilyticus TaxID=512399 RepID=UPI001428C7E4|nr:hypothetical protein [Paenibacillus pectinilyticus]
MNDHWLENHFKGWSNEALKDRRQEIILDASKMELKMIDRELERRKEAEEVA